MTDSIAQATAGHVSAKQATTAQPASEQQLVEGLNLEGPRQASEQDLADIVAFLNHVFRTLAGREPTISLDHPQVYSPANIQNVSIVRNGGAIVASTGVFAADVRIDDVCLRVGDINCVGVLPEYRRRGLGNQVMAAARRQMLAIGCQVGILTTDIDNWYRAQGWERAGCKRSYRIDRGNMGLWPELPDGISVRFGGEESIEEVLRLHHAGRLGAERTGDVFRLVLQARRNPQILLADKDGEALAYALVREATIVEWGGEAELAAGLARAFFAHIDRLSVSRSMRDTSFKAMRLQCMHMVTPDSGRPIMGLLDERRIPFSRDYIGMLSVLDPAAVLHDYGHGDISVAEQEGRFTLKRGQKTATLGACELVKLFFGPERICDFAADIFPLPFWQWPLDIF